MTEKIKKADKAALWAGICVVVALFFMLFVYAPIEIYSYNIDEFWFDLYQLMPMMLGIFVGAVLFSAAVLWGICVLFPRVYRMVLLPVLCILFLCTYVQGTFMVDNLPPMDGSVPKLSDYSAEIAQSCILWIVVTIGVVLLAILLRGGKFAKAIRLVSICMLLMFAVTSVSVLMMTGSYKKKLDACSTTKDEYLFSGQENFIILVLDSVDAKTLSELMEERPEYKDVFEDFTYYENMLGAYPCTGVALPHILSGKWFENETTIQQYKAESYKNSPILDALSKEGYRLGMYVTEMPYEDESVFRFSNVLARNVRVGSYFDFARLELKLVGVRYAPYWLKPYCVFKTGYFTSLWEKDDEYPAYITENKDFYDKITANEISLTDEKCFKLLHVEGGHVPFVNDENVNVITDGTYRDSLKATVTLTSAYLDKLKAAGVYDNSVIVIMADHGFAEEFGHEEDVEACEGRQNPIFFAKGIGEHHDMEVSQAPVSYEDLQEAFSGLLQGKSGGEIFRSKEGEARTRRYIYYDFVFDEFMYEYESAGHASDDAALVPTGQEYFREN